MAAVLLTPPYLQFEDENGLPLAGGLIYTYAAGTTTPKATYTDSTATVQAANPVVLDSAGRTTLWGIGAYKIVVQNSSGVPIKTTDNIVTFNTVADAAPSYFQSFSGNGVQTVFTLSQDMGTDENSIMVFVDKGGSPPLGTPDSDTFSGTGAQTVFTLSKNVGTNGYNIQVHVAGLYVDNYTVNGTTLTFGAAPASGTNNIKVVYEAYGKGFDVLNPNLYTLNGTSLTFVTAPASGTNNILVFAPSTLVGAASASAALADAAATAAGNSAAAAIAAATNSPVYNCPTVGGTANTVLLTTSSTVTSYVDGQIFEWQPTLNNTLSSVQVNINGLGVLTLLDCTGSAPYPGILSTSAPVAAMRYGSFLYVIGAKPVVSTFTPTLTFGGSATGMTGTFTGIEYRLGKAIWGTINITLTAKGSSTGAASVGGLVYPADTKTYPVNIDANNLASISGSLQGRLPTTTSALVLSYLGTGTLTALTDVNFTNTTRLSINYNYTTT